MLFSNKSSDTVRDNLIRLVEASVLCLSVLGSKDMCEDDRVKHAHNELYDAMSSVVDKDVSSHAEYDYILYRAKLKLNLLPCKSF